MTIEAVGTLGYFVFDCVEEGAVVGGPGGACDACDFKWQKRVSSEIFDCEWVLAKAGDVCGVGEELVVVADVEGAETEEGVAFGKGVQVQEEFVGGVFRVAAAKVDGILLAFLCAREVLEAAERVGDREVGLLDA